MVRANKDKRLKVLLVNGSPHRSGNTFTALSEVARTLEEEGMEAEIVHVGNRPVQGCIGCYKCREKGVCVFQDETYLTLREKLAEADGIIIGSPVYFGGPSGSLCALLDRLFYSSGRLAQYKPAASVVVCRRRSHRHFRPAEQILHHPQYARRSVTILEQRARAKSGRSLAGCGRPADHAHAGSQHGVDAAQPARQYSPLRNRRKATYKLYPIICV